MVYPDRLFRTDGLRRDTVQNVNDHSPVTGHPEVDAHLDLLRLGSEFRPSAWRLADGLGPVALMWLSPARIDGHVGLIAITSDGVTFADEYGLTHTPNDRIITIGQEKPGRWRSRPWQLRFLDGSRGSFCYALPTPSPEDVAALQAVIRVKRRPRSA